MSNDELASNDELKEFKEEGEEDRLASEHLHSRLKNNLLDQVRFFHAFNLPFNVPSTNHHGNSSHSASQSIYSSPFTDAHHPFFTHHHRAPPPAHMGRYFPLDLDTSAKSISPWALSTYPSLFHYHHTDSSSFQWHHPHPHHHSPTTTMYQSPFHFNLNFPPLSPHHPHPLSSPLPHSFFYSPTHATHLTPPSTSASPHSHSTPQPHQNPPTPSSQPSDTTQFTLLSPSQNSSSNSPSNVQNHVKKPLNAFMLFMKENRSEVAAVSLRKESATINKILGEKWQSLSAEEQAVYYEKAKSQRELHRELYPCWTARDNYANNNKKKKKKREKSSENEGSLKKCRARFGLEHQASWCKPCRRKKKCIRFSSDKTDEC